MVSNSQVSAVKQTVLSRQIVNLACRNSLSCPAGESFLWFGVVQRTSFLRFGKKGNVKTSAIRDVGFRRCFVTYCRFSVATPRIVQGAVAVPLYVLKIVVLCPSS